MPPLSVDEPTLSAIFEGKSEKTRKNNGMFSQFFKAKNNHKAKRWNVSSSLRPTLTRRLGSPCSEHVSVGWQGGLRRHQSPGTTENSQCGGDGYFGRRLVGVLFFPFHLKSQLPKWATTDRNSLYLSVCLSVCLCLFICLSVYTTTASSNIARALHST